jgi:hypothetical protein
MALSELINDVFGKFEAIMDCIFSRISLVMPFHSEAFTWMSMRDLRFGIST